MEKIRIKIQKDREVIQFEVAEYLHHEGDRCKFDVFKDGEFVVGLEPDAHEYLRICKNPGILNEEIIYLIADRIEALQL
jgi:hypothetical protein